MLKRNISMHRTRTHHYVHNSLLQAIRGCQQYGTNRDDSKRVATSEGFPIFGITLSKLAKHCMVNVPM